MVTGAVTTINESFNNGPVNTINAQGQVLINEWGPVGLFHVLVQNPDGSHAELPHLPGEPAMIGMAINHVGQVAGWTGVDPTTTAFLYTRGVMHSLGTLPGDTTSMAYGLNNAGQVVGSSQGANGTHAFLYSNGTMHDIGTLGGNSTVAYGISSSGEVYGRASLADGTYHEFLYQAGKMLDFTNFLHSLPSPISQFSHYSVNGISDRGQILVAAFNLPEDFSTFLLTPQGQSVPTTPGPAPTIVPVTVSPYTPPPAPVPEPSVLAFFATVIAGAACRRLLRRTRA
jgi:probable HAF family extracellular repeat protein